jgi:circadian clock protein KaiC
MASGGERASSGVAGLDDILVGGFIRGHLHLVQGRSGTGKTTLGLQFVLAGRDQGEKVLYVAMSETCDELRLVADSHGWSLDGIEVSELTPPGAEEGDGNRQTVFHPSEVELGETMRLLFEQIERVDPERVVIDSLTEMRLLTQNPLRYRRQVLALKYFLARRHSTVLVLDDTAADGQDQQLQSIAHAVVCLEQWVLDYGAERRRLRVPKMRGVSFRGGYHDYAIRTGGLEVFPRLVAAEYRQTLPKDVIRSGSEILDALLGGGLRRGTSALLVGPAGSGKSSIALTIAVNTARQGERAALYIFDEGSQSIEARASGLGMEIGPLMSSGVMELHQVDPAEMPPGEFTALVRRGVDERNVKIVVIDSLNGYLQAMPQERFLALELHQLLTYLNQLGILTLLVLAQHGLVGAVQPPVDLSYLSDAVLLLRYFEGEGRIRKAISVVKKRIGAHENTIREFQLSARGLELGEPLTDFQGIMSGVPTYLGSHGMMRTFGDTSG